MTDFARELHDGPLQTATALDLRLQLLLRHYPDDTDALAALEAVEGLLADLRTFELRLRDAPP